MSGRKRRTAQVVGGREAQAIAATLGRDARATRRRRRLTQARLGALVNLSQSEISRLERGLGAGAAVETWVAIGIALGRPIAIGFSRDTAAPLNDAGHADAQELVARIATVGGWRPSFEVPDDPRAPSGSTDLRIDRSGSFALIEIWNRVDDFGAAVRSSDRKVARAGARTQSLWLLSDTAANRAIVRRYPTVLRTRFPGSSSGWIRAVTAGGALPVGPGLAWVDLRAGRLRALRLADG